MVSDGPRPRVIPDDLVGRPFAEVAAELEALSLVGRTGSRSRHRIRPRAASCGVEPGPGTEVERDSTVDRRRGHRPRSRCPTSRAEHRRTPPPDSRPPASTSTASRGSPIGEVDRHRPLAGGPQVDPGSSVTLITRQRRRRPVTLHHPPPAPPGSLAFRPGRARWGGGDEAIPSRHVVATPAGPAPPRPAESGRYPRPVTRGPTARPLGRGPGRHRGGVDSLDPAARSAGAPAKAEERGWYPWLVLTTTLFGLLSGHVHHHDPGGVDPDIADDFGSIRDHPDLADHRADAGLRRARPVGGQARRPAGATARSTWSAWRAPRSSPASSALSWNVAVADHVPHPGRGRRRRHRPGLDGHDQPIVPARATGAGAGLLVAGHGRRAGPRRGRSAVRSSRRSAGAGSSWPRYPVMLIALPGRLRAAARHRRHRSTREVRRGGVDRAGRRRAASLLFAMNRGPVIGLDQHTGASFAFVLAPVLLVRVRAHRAAGASTR